jgi:uncharacterized membrane protein
MRKINIFLILLISSIISLTVVIALGIYISSTLPYPSNWIGEMWSHMGGMTGTTGMPVQDPILPYFSLMVVVFVSLATASAGGLIYFFMFPEIKRSHQPTNPAHSSSGKATAAYEAVIKTLTDEEQKVIQVLTVHDGKYLQKYIRKEAGLSRLKTHRILSRLADRGIVTLRKFGNTNEVLLSDWLHE